MRLLATYIVKPVLRVSDVMSALYLRIANATIAERRGGFFGTYRFEWDSVNESQIFVYRRTAQAYPHVMRTNVMYSRFIEKCSLDIKLLNSKWSNYINLPSNRISSYAFGFF